MADYKQAFQEGLEAARKAERAKKEIEEVLTVFKNIVLSETDGKLLIELRELEERDEPAVGYVMKFSLVKRHYTALVVSNQKIEKPNFKELAKWERAKSG